MKGLEQGGGNSVGPVRLDRKTFYIEDILNGKNTRHKGTKTESVQVTLEISVSQVMG